MKDEELQKKREEAERKARRGEIDPTHEFTFLLIGQVTGEGVDWTGWGVGVTSTQHLYLYNRGTGGRSTCLLPCSCLFSLMFVF
jgi:hypothetical protein